MKTNVEASGEDLVVIIPQKLMDALGLKPGDDVDIAIEHRKAIVTPMKSVNNSEV